MAAIPIVGSQDELETVLRSTDGLVGASLNRGRAQQFADAVCLCVKARTHLAVEWLCAAAQS